MLSSGSSLAQGACGGPRPGAAATKQLSGLGRHIETLLRLRVQEDGSLERLGEDPAVAAAQFA